MLSFNYHINKYTIELDLANNRGWKFDENGKIGPVCQGPEATKVRMLSIMHENLKKAPVYYLNPRSLFNFLQSIINYTKNIEKHESKKIKQTSNKINELVLGTDARLTSPFKGNAAKEINVILDKNPAEISVDEYHLLLHLANGFAYNRRYAFIFYKRAAIIENIKKLRKDCPNLSIERTAEEWTPSIQLTIPTNIFDLQLWLLIEFHSKNNPNHYNEINPEFLRKVVKRKIESSNPIFKSYLNTYLITHGIASLCQDWKEINKEHENLKKFNDKLSEANEIIKDFNRYAAELIFESPIFTKLISIASEYAPFVGEEIDYGKIAKELFDYANDRNKPFDQWYTGMYNKIQAYQSLHPEVELPLISPEIFCASKDFTDPRSIKIPILEQIHQLEEEEQRLFEKKQKTAIKPVERPLASVSQKVPSSPIQTPPQPIDEPKSEDSIPSISEIISSLSPEEQEREWSEEISIDTAIQAEEKVPLVGTSSQREMIQHLPAPSPRQKINPQRLRKLLRKTSPFKVSERILAWFDPQQTPVSLNEESRFIHNFAWASNEILWHYGMRYPRENKDGIKQPAIAMLCQVDQAAYHEKKLFRVTLTFDQNTADPSFAYDSSLLCYHRTLTRREQNQNDVEKYIRNGKNQFIDFPSLPSQLVHTDIPSDLLDKKYPDGSFVESVKGSIITIRDPKNDEGKKRCRIHLFVVR